jgi:hypothetical protein
MRWKNDWKWEARDRLGVSISVLMLYQLSEDTAVYALRTYLSFNLNHNNLSI